MAHNNSKEWFVVRTKPQKEEFARLNLERREVEVYLPRIVGTSASERPVPTPLFPCYLFVKLSLTQGYHRVVWTPGVKGFVAFGQEPAPVDDEVVEYLQHRTGEDGLIRPENRLRVGDRVKVTRGPFSGLIGIIERPCGRKGRIKVLMDFLKRGIIVDLPLVAVGRV